MDSQQFLAEFGHIANARNGISRLRELILSLAVRGHLVRQNIDAIDTSESISIKIGEQKKNETKIRFRILNAVTTNDAPHEIPNNWTWVRLGEVVEILDGMRKPVTKSSRMPGPYPYYGASGIVDYVAAYIFDEPLVLVGEDGAKWERGENSAFLISGKTWVNNHAHVLRPRREFLSDEFLVYSLIEMNLSPFITGMTVPKLNQARLISIPLPLPPLEEQARIVAKVDELMALCDKLEAQQQERRKLQNHLRQSTLQGVATATSPHELQATWTCLAKNFGLLFHATEDAAELRKLILDLAVSGYLTEFNESDESALVLRNRIIQTKERGVAEGSVVHKKPVKPENLQETVLPSHWESITLDEAISTIDAGWSPACLPSARDNESKWGILKTTSVQRLRFLPHEHKELPTSLTPKPQYQIEIGDILITRAGPKNRVGICCVVDDAPPRLMISDKLIRFHIVDDLISARFVALCLSAGEPGRILERLKSGMADSQMNISQDKLRAITIPLPPIAEQHRIFAKVESMMRIIDGLEERLRKKEELGNRLATAAISNVTGIATEQDEEPMKAPQTELIAPLRLGKVPDIKAQSPLATILARHNGEMPAKDLWQRFGGEIDAFYAQLKTEVAHGWILEPPVAEMREKRVESADA